MTHHVWVLIGPSGTGKTTLAKDLPRLLPGVKRAITCTTRIPRPGEQDGVDYRFLTPVQFEELLVAGRLIEWTEYGGARYGLPADQFESLTDNDLVCVMDLAGVRHLRERLPAERVRAVFLQTPLPEVLAARMRSRGSSNDEIERRLALQVVEREQAQACDYVIATDPPYDMVLRQVRDLLDPPGLESAI